MCAGFIGDRFGGRLPMRLGIGGLIIGLAGFVSFNSGELFVACFAIWGAALCMGEIGFLTMTVEICPDKKRPTYISLLALTCIPISLCTGLLSGWLHSIGGITLLAGLSSIGLLMAAWLSGLLPEPRKQRS